MLLAASADDPPSQIYADLSSVIQGLNSVEYDSPLGGHDSHKKIESRGTETIPHEKSAQEAKS